jgi:predicted dehydrogenase
MTDRRLKVGIVGAHWGVEGLLPGWRAVDDADVVAICTAHRDTAEKAAKDYGIPQAYWRYEDMLANAELDIVTLGSRPPLRVSMARQALEADIHVFNNLPFAVELSDAKELLALQRKKGLVGVCDAYFRWLPEVQYLKELIDDGYLGDLHAVTGNFQLPHFFGSGAVDSYRWTAFSANGTGVTRNTGSHLLHLLLHLFGEIESISGQAECFNREWTSGTGDIIRPQVFDTATAQLQFRSGAIGTMNVGRTVPAGRGLFIEAHGSKGRIVAQSPSYARAKTTLLFGVGSKDGTTTVEKKLDVPARLYAVAGKTWDEIQNPEIAVPVGKLFFDMIRAIRSGGDAAPSFYDAVTVQATITAWEIAARERRWVRIRDVLAGA